MNIADRIRFDGHDEIGARIAVQICRRLRFSTDDTQQIEALVAQPVPEDAELASFIPFLEIAAARHARADLRLFAN